MSENQENKGSVGSDSDISEAEQLSSLESEFGAGGSESVDYMPSSEQVDSVLSPEEVEIYPVLLMAGNIASGVYARKREAQGLKDKGFSEEKVNMVAAPLSVAISQDLPELAEVGPWGAVAIGTMAISAQVFMDELELKKLQQDGEAKNK